MKNKKSGFEEIMVKNVGGDLPDFNASEAFFALHMALENLRDETLEGVPADICFESVADLANIAEILYEMKNRLRKAKGVPELNIEDMAELKRHVCSLILHHPRCDCGRFEKGKIGEIVYDGVDL